MRPLLNTSMAAIRLARRTGLYQGMLMTLTPSPFEVVLAEDVDAEVAVGIAPYAMRVVAGALRVVVLDEQTRPLDPIVMRPSALGGPGPGEGERGEVLVGVPGELGVGQLGRQAGDVDSDDLL